MKRRIIALSAAMLTLCGCSHKTEVRDKGFVRTIGCDDGMLQSVAVRLYGDTNVLTGVGQTIFSAVENAETAQGKTLFTGHLELLVLSEGDIREKLSVLIKNNRISPSCSVIVTPDSATKAVTDYKEEELSGLLDSYDRKGRISRKNISDVLNDLLEDDNLAASPVLSEDRLTMGIISHTGVEAILSEDESNGFCWLTGSLHDFYLPVEVGGKTASFQVRNSKTRLTAAKQGESIAVTTEIKINGSCIEEGVSETDAANAAAEKISSLCSKTISKTVTGMKADVLGIKKTIVSANIDTESTWEEIIPRLRFYYSIKIAS